MVGDGSLEFHLRDVHIPTPGVTAGDRGIRGYVRSDASKCRVVSPELCPRLSAYGASFMAGYCSINWLDGMAADGI